jgi:hypothetical protein
MAPITNRSTPAEFKQALSNIHWFSHIGDETEYPYSIGDWEDWLGPEDPMVMPLGSWQQELYDGLLASAGDKATELKELWDEVLDKVLQTASKSVPYDASQDAWHAPTTAVWSAAWTAALVVSFLFLSRPLPVDLITQWRWYVKGRWPCAYAARTEEGADRFLQWYSEGFPSKGLGAEMEENPNEFVVL